MEDEEAPRHERDDAIKAFLDRSAEALAGRLLSLEGAALPQSALADEPDAQPTTPSQGPAPWTLGALAHKTAAPKATPVTETPKPAVSTWLKMLPPKPVLRRPKTKAEAEDIGTNTMAVRFPSTSALARFFL